jgi:hypothetical protein
MYLPVFSGCFKLKEKSTLRLASVAAKKYLWRMAPLHLKTHMCFLFLSLDTIQSGYGGSWWRYNRPKRKS